MVHGGGRRGPQGCIVHIVLIHQSGKVCSRRQVGFQGVVQRHKGLLIVPGREVVVVVLAEEGLRLRRLFRPVLLHQIRPDLRLLHIERHKAADVEGGIGSDGGLLEDVGGGEHILV